MTTKKTATKKVARKRTSKNETEAGVVDSTTESVPMSSENVEEAPKKRAPRKTAKNSAPDDAPEQTERKEPIQGVRDRRTQKNEDETVKPEPRNTGDTRSQQDENSAEGDQNQQGKGRNRRGRRNRTKGDQPQAQQQVQAPQIDAKELSKRAWKIFLSEVSEEGLALIGDKEGRELSKKSFRLAEIFLEEQGRRSTPKPQPQQQRRRQNQDTNPVVEEVTSTEEVKDVAVADITPVETPRAEESPSAQSED